MIEVDWRDHQRRANELGDSIRRYLLTVNSGGIGVMFALAGSMLDKVSPVWVVWPTTLFGIGVGLVGASTLLARYREIERESAAKERRVPREFPRHMLSAPYHLFSLIAFLAGVGVGLYTLNLVSAGLVVGGAPSVPLR